MAYPPPSGGPMPHISQPPMRTFVPLMPPHPMGLPLPPPGMHPGMLPLPLMPLPMMPPMLQTSVSTSAEPVLNTPDLNIPVVSAADMKVATTVFVGNISDKASDTLVRQILLRCGYIQGWKRVQDASGKLQAFGFCEYGDPEATLRALRLLHGLKLGTKSLVVKVDAKTRKDLLQYLCKKKYVSKNVPVDDTTIEQEVARLEEIDGGNSALTEDIDDDTKITDAEILSSINLLVKDHIEFLTSDKTSEQVQLEQDVKESIFSMAIQSGRLDTNSSLEDVVMEEGVKTMVSDEIKRFRQSYQHKGGDWRLTDSASIDNRQESEDIKAKRKREQKDHHHHHRSEDGRPPRATEEREGGKPRKDPSPPAPSSSSSSSHGRGRSPVGKRERDRSASPPPPSSSRRNRSRSPPTPRLTRVQERQAREQRRQVEKQRELELSLKDEEEHEERQRKRIKRDREIGYKERASAWESRERRKVKEFEKLYEKETEKAAELVREKRHLAEFLEDYDDGRDDQRYYRGSAYARRRRERELEREDDRRDALRERDEMEALQLELMERQAREILPSSDNKKDSGLDSSSGGGGDQMEDDDDDDLDIPVREVEEDIPLAKADYSVPPAYPPIQVHSAPVVRSPDERGGARREETEPHLGSREELLKKEDEHSNSASPMAGPKFMFGLRKSSTIQVSTPPTLTSSTSTTTATAAASTSSVSAVPSSSSCSSSSSSSSSVAATAAAAAAASDPSKQAKAKLEAIFSMEDDEVESKPKRKLVPIDYGDMDDPTSTAERRVSAEERKKRIQSLVNGIPTAKEEVFSYQLKWEQIDALLVEKRVGPWINKKIIEYIGEAEPSLTDFICNKLACHIPPEQILSDISMVLDDEAEVFVVKLWRLLIYETEAKHMGIAKNY